MRHHRRPTEPTNISTRRRHGRFVRSGALVLSAASLVAVAGFVMVSDARDRTGGPRFLTAEQPATALGTLVALP